MYTIDIAIETKLDNDDIAKRKKATINVVLTMQEQFSLGPSQGVLDVAAVCPGILPGHVRHHETDSVPVSPGRHTQPMLGTYEVEDV